MAAFTALENLVSNCLIKGLIGRFSLIVHRRQLLQDEHAFGGLILIYYYHLFFGRSRSEPSVDLMFCRGQANQFLCPVEWLRIKGREEDL